MDRTQSRPGRTNPGCDVRRGRTRPRPGRPPGDGLAVGGRAGATRNHDPGRVDPVARDDRRDGPDRGPQEPLAYGGALDHRRDLYQNPESHPPNVIAIQSMYASIAITLHQKPSWPT